MVVAVFLFSLALGAAPAVHDAPAGGRQAQPTCADPSLKRARNGGIEIAYRTAGSRGGTPLLLVPGSGMQLTDWPRPLVDGLVRAGYFVVIPDLRDAGCSTKLDELGPPDWARILGDMAAGRAASPAYGVGDMVSDLAAVLDAEGLRSVHVMGASGGSIIAEVMAVTIKQRVRSLTLLMANAGNPARAVPAKPQVMASVAQPPAFRDGPAVERYLAGLERILTGPAAPPEPVLLERARTRIARGYSADGVQRQGAAFLTAGDLRQRLAEVTVPTTVIHGAEDPLIPVDAGRDVASAVPGARFELLPQSGHALDPDMVAAALRAVRDGARGVVGR